MHDFETYDSRFLFPSNAPDPDKPRVINTASYHIPRNNRRCVHVAGEPGGACYLVNRVTTALKRNDEEGGDVVGRGRDARKEEEGDEEGYNRAHGWIISRHCDARRSGSTRPVAITLINIDSLSRTTMACLPSPPLPFFPIPSPFDVCVFLAMFYASQPRKTHPRARWDEQPLFSCFSFESREECVSWVACLRRGTWARETSGARVGSRVNRPRGVVRVGRGTCSFRRCGF